MRLSRDAIYGAMSWLINTIKSTRLSCIRSTYYAYHVPCVVVVEFIAEGTAGSDLFLEGLFSTLVVPYRLITLTDSVIR